MKVSVESLQKNGSIMWTIIANKDHNWAQPLGF